MLQNPKIIFCNEDRIYYCKWGQIPFKARVKLIAKIYFENGYRMGIFEWNGKKYNAPLRVLRRVKREMIPMKKHLERMER